MDFQKGYAKCAHCGEIGLVFVDEGFPSPIDTLFVIDCVCPKCGKHSYLSIGNDTKGIFTEIQPLQNIRIKD